MWIRVRPTLPIRGLLLLFVFVPKPRDEGVEVRGRDEGEAVVVVVVVAAAVVVVVGCFMRGGGSRFFLTYTDSQPLSLSFSLVKS